MALIVVKYCWKITAINPASLSHASSRIDVNY